MKVIINPIFRIILWLCAFVIGNIYSALYFIYDPKGMINEKRSKLVTTGNYKKDEKGDIKWETDWWKTFISYYFWFPPSDY